MNTISIKGITDFNLAHIFECGQCFRWNEIDGSFVGVAMETFVKRRQMEGEGIDAIE